MRNRPDVTMVALKGFVRFTAGWYLVAITKRTVVALLGGHYLYHCEETQMYQVTYNQRVEKPSEEQRCFSAIISFAIVPSLTVIRHEIVSWQPFVK